VAALEAREVLADGVQLADGRAGRQEQARDLLLLRERDGRRRSRRQGRPPARDEEEHEVVFAGAARQLEQARGRGDPARVRHGVAGLGELDPWNRHRATILHDDEAARDPVPHRLLGGGRHGGARLAAAEDKDTPATGIEAQVTADQRGHVAGGER
jgi:hypothetical protein